MSEELPTTIPTRVKVHGRVHGDGPFRATYVDAGEYPCHSNRYGAVSVKATDGSMLGLRPHEFTVLETSPNPAIGA